MGKSSIFHVKIQENIGTYGKKQEHIETLLENMGTYIGKMLGFRLPKGVFL